MIGAIILAAGQSRRMGRPKLLLPLRGRPVIAWVIDAVLSSPVDQVVAVVGPGSDALRAELALHAVRVVENHARECEMLDSVRTGLAALPSDCSHVLVLLGDQPTVSATLIRALLREAATSARGIVVPTHAGRRGHPILVAYRHRETLMSGHDQEGLRGLLRAHPEDVAEVTWDDASVLMDLDTPADYERATSAC